MATPLPVLGSESGWPAATGCQQHPRRAVAERDGRGDLPGGHPAPADDCRCGIYAIEDWPRLGDDRLYEEAAVPMRLLAQGLLGAVVLAGWRRCSSWIARWWPGQLVPALVIGVAMVIGLTGVIAADLAIMRPAYVLGAVLLSGRVLRYENGVMRAEHARIACLVRPIGVQRSLVAPLAARLGVPVFHWYQRERALRYLSEHGDSWARAMASL